MMCFLGLFVAVACRFCVGKQVNDGARRCCWPRRGALYPCWLLWSVGTSVYTLCKALLLALHTKPYVLVALLVQSYDIVSALLRTRCTTLRCVRNTTSTNSWREIRVYSRPLCSACAKTPYFSAVMSVFRPSLPIAARLCCHLNGSLPTQPMEHAVCALLQIFNHPSPPPFSPNK